MPELVERITIEGSRMTVQPSRLLKSFVPKDFYVEYDSLLPLGETPSQIRLLPFLWNVAPIVWAAGLELEVDVLDPRVADSFEAVRNELRAMYPDLAWNGEITAHSLEAVPDPPGSQYRRAALFSGGVDSVWTALRHSGPDLLLISVRDEDDRTWERVKARNARFVANHAGGLAVIRSNFRNLNYLVLRSLTSQIPSWWESVQHGMAYTGLTAPLIHRFGVPTLHIASTLTAAVDTNWASSPRLDNRVSLGTAGVTHDSFELSRQEKVTRIVAHYREQKLDPPELYVCLDQARSGGINCERCQKCIRTAVGVAVAGGDPRRYGFQRFGPAFLDDLRQGFGQFRYHLSDIQVFLWNDVKGHMPPASELDGPFWTWLRQMDFEAYRATQREPGALSRRSKIWIGARVPRLYRLVRHARKGS